MTYTATTAHDRAVLLLDSTVLVAYEHDLTRRAQALVLEALVDGRLMVTAALSRPWPAPS